MNEHHFGAVFKDQVSDSTVGQSDSHQVLALQRQNLYKQNHLSTSLIKHTVEPFYQTLTKKEPKTNTSVCFSLDYRVKCAPSVTVFVSECTCTCTWSSSVTGSEVLVDLSAIRFLLTAIRGLALERSTQNNRVQG